MFVMEISVNAVLFGLGLTLNPPNITPPSLGPFRSVQECRAAEDRAKRTIADQIHAEVRRQFGRVISLDIKTSCVMQQDV